jgi:hypothetical protein
MQDYNVTRRAIDLRDVLRENILLAGRNLMSAKVVMQGQLCGNPTNMNFAKALFHRHTGFSNGAHFYRNIYQDKSGAYLR